MLDKNSVFLVGGAVRDILLGFEPKDKDYVVINHTEQDMLDLGFEKVGKDFPVFLHPNTGFEYALARKEKKSGHGYNGFSFETKNVTLEEDLFRRDLTINAMAMNYKNEIIDPFNGKKDLYNNILKHVSNHFAEDPLRILRTARFSARYNYEIHTDTLNLMSSMIKNGEFNYLTPERVWKELEKVLSEKYLINFFQVLEKIGANKIIFKKDQFNDIQFLKSLENSNNNNNVLKYSFLFSQLDKKLLNELKIPNEVKQLTQYFKNINNENWKYTELSAEDKIKFILSTRSLQCKKNAILTIKNICVYNSWKNNFDIDINNEIYSFNKDINELKQIKYTEIVKEAKDNNININSYVLQYQLNIIKNKLRI